MQTHQLIRAIGAGLVVMLTGLLTYDRPQTDLVGALWQPMLQGVLAALTSLGIGNAVKRPVE